MSVGDEERSSRIRPPCSLNVKKVYGDGTEELHSPESLRISSMSPDLRQDFSMMEQRKRVTQILQSPDFKEELECMVKEQYSKSSNSGGLLGHIANIIISNTLNNTGVYSPANVGSVSPVNDLCGVEWFNCSKAERQGRCKLACLYRLLDLYGHTHFPNTYITLRVSKEQDHILILPKGLSFSEATAASLVKVNLIGEVVDQGATLLPVDVLGFKPHAAVYSARPDAKCVIHTHTPTTAAVSCMKCGILPISHEALLLGEVSYFSYHGDIDDEQERMDLQKALGPTAKVLVLRNQGLLAFGETTEEAFHYLYHSHQACEIQVSALLCAGGIENLCILNRTNLKVSPTPSIHAGGEMPEGQIRWRVGEAEFESLMRMLDNLGYRTGYTYRHPIVKEKPRHHNNVEIPATVTGMGLEEKDFFPQSPLHFAAQKRDRERIRWLNSPNSYLKVNVPEESINGTCSPCSKTVWMKSEESGSCKDTPIRIEDPNQFVPLNTNPNEVLEKRNKIREQNRVDLMTAGPKSQLLADIVIDKPPGPAFIYEDEEQTDSLPPNPFDQSEAELQEYTQTVENKCSQSALQSEADEEFTDGEMTTYDGSTVSLSISPLMSPERGDCLSALLLSSDELTQDDDLTLQVTELSITKEMQVSITTTVANNISVTSSSESQPKLPKKKKKKFRTPSFLRMSKKKEREKEKGKDKEKEKEKENKEIEEEKECNKD
ncbi:gamma-adducin-like [Myxocyprinus asiaticus]|uniref:gamma-adducin-like n=1 Tax=Myxocyprinus asiaticus TaxID=70543 RepID=UPI002221C540|nr:gamma-adducin-like [Myxocyprinus asiaticus]XP_051502875.1 gamma-adducin-like [Myxocyprinus asiaticus]